MQTTKDYKRTLLLDTARTAFFEKGFKAVSMREISKKSGVGLSNIYNYYPSKDDLLVAILHPLLEAMDKMMREHNRTESLTMDIFTSEEYLSETMHKIFWIVSHFRRELQLLLLAPQGSRFSHYVEKWTVENTTIGMEYLKEMKALYPQLYTDISPFFMRFVCSWWVGMIREVVTHEELSEEEIERFIGEYIRFSTGGWKNLMRVAE